MKNLNVILTNAKKIFSAVPCLSMRCIKSSLVLGFSYLPIALMSYMGVYCIDCGEPIWTCVFGAAVCLSLFLGYTIMRSKKWDAPRVPFISLISSVIAIFASFAWCCVTNQGLYLLDFSAACVFVSMGMLGIKSITIRENKMEKVLFILWTIFFFAFSFSLIYDGVNSLIVIPEWATTVGNVLYYVGASAFALGVGAVAALFAKVANEVSGGLKPIVKCIAAAIVFVSLGVMGSIIFDLLGYEMMPILLAKILMWGIMLSVGCALLIGLCLGVATLCSKSR